MPTLSVKLATPVGRAAIVVARLLVAGMFLWAGVPKILDPAVFAQDIANYQLVPDATIAYLAVIVPVIEIVVAVALVAGVEARGAALLAGAMLVVFAAAMIQAMVRDIDLSCGCFGSTTESEVGWGSVARNLGLTAACLLVVAGPEVRWRSPLREQPAPR